VTAGEEEAPALRPVVARSREPARFVGIVTTPFRFEGTRRSAAERGVEELRTACDTVIVIPNDSTTEIDRSTSMIDASRSPTTSFGKSVQGICDLITTPGLINLDFADVRTVMQDAGSALMGIGYSSGQNRAREAAERALGSPLIDAEIVSARGILLSIAGGDDLSLVEVNDAAEVVRAKRGRDDRFVLKQHAAERFKVRVALGRRQAARASSTSRFRGTGIHVAASG
jgi:cell division protein FtsZ